MEKDFLIIVNPKAGGGKTRKFTDKIVAEAKRYGVGFDVKITERRGDARKFSSENLGNYKNYIAVGGDGTLNEVVNGFDLSFGKLPRLGVLPLGSGNDFGKLMHGKRKINEILTRYFGGEVKTFVADFCKAKIIEENKKVVEFKFINALGIGFDSYVAKENLDNKIFGGVTSYVISVLKGLKKFKGVKAKVTVDGERLTDGEALLLVTIGNNKTSGGGFYLNPFAKIDDGKLDVTTIKHLPALSILKNLPLTLIDKTETVRGFVHRNGKNITVELTEPFIVHADGEIFSTKAETVEVGMFDKQIELIA